MADGNVAEWVKVFAIPVVLQIMKYCCDALDQISTKHKCKPDRGNRKTNITVIGLKKGIFV